MAFWECVSSDSFKEVSVVISHCLLVFDAITLVIQSCRTYGFARQLLLLFNQVIVSCQSSAACTDPDVHVPLVLLAMRIIALYHNSLRVVIFVIGSGLALLGVACVSIKLILLGRHLY